MHGRKWMIGLLLLCGCTELPESAPVQPTAPRLSAFDLASTGTIEGRVTWDADVPTLSPVLMTANAYHNCLYTKPVRCVPPHQPQVRNGGVGDVVVFLRGVDPQRARPWDHGAVGVEFRDRQMILKQGEFTCGAAFVRRGDAIETVNLDTDYQALRARGAEVFGLPLVKPNMPSRRTITHNGIVELTSGAGYYWQHAFLFVDEHPYYTRTDAEGRFKLEEVPAGTYQIVCWMPSWRVIHKEIDPETAIVARLQWAAPVERRQNVEVHVGKTEVAEFRWSRTVFEK
jgi:hypothetical protein